MLRMSTEEILVSKTPHNPTYLQTEIWMEISPTPKKGSALLFITTGHCLLYVMNTKSSLNVRGPCGTCDGCKLRISSSHMPLATSAVRLNHGSQWPGEDSISRVMSLSRSVRAVCRNRTVLIIKSFYLID